jgi:hypothetical protein
MFLKFLLALTFSALLITGCGNSEKSKSDSEPAETEGQKSEPFDSVVIVMGGEDGKSVFYITQKYHHVGFIESSVGNFVHVIDSLETNSKFSWLYSVNDTMGTVASDRRITSDSDTIKWHYRKN